MSQAASLEMEAGSLAQLATGNKPPRCVEWVVCSVGFTTTSMAIATACYKSPSGIFDEHKRAYYASFISTIIIGIEEVQRHVRQGDLAGNTIKATVPLNTVNIYPYLSLYLSDDFPVDFAFFDGGAALALSFVICKAGTAAASRLGIQGGTLPCVTALVVLLATVFPALLGRLAPSGETMALILMQVFFTVVGANGSVVDAVTKAPSVFSFAVVQVIVHLAVVLGAGKLMGLERKSLLIASNANVGGPTTAAAMATAKGWSSLVVRGILVGIFGISIATFLGIGFGMLVLRRI